MEVRRYILGLNPVPWATPPMSVGRGKGGGLFVRAGRNQELYSYQQAVREAIANIDDRPPMTGPYCIRFGFSRELFGKAMAADATNLQKATEDALQGVTIENDSAVVDIGSRILDQGAGAGAFVFIEVAGNGYALERTDEEQDLVTSYREATTTFASLNEWPPKS